MTRVKRGKISLKRRKNVLKRVKGYRFGRSTKEALAREAIFHAGAHAFRDRRKKKRTNRGLWTTKINALATELGISYSKLIGALKKANVEIDRKVLSQIAETEPKIFEKIVSEVK